MLTRPFGREGSRPCGPMLGAPMGGGFLGLTAAPPLRVLVGALQKKGRQFGLNLYNRAFARGKQANRPAGEGEAPFGG